MSSSPSPLPACVVPPSTSAPLRAFGEEVEILLSGAQTAGRYSMWHESTPPGGGPPPHLHQHQDEWFYVLEGSAEFLLDGWKPLAPGGAVFVPRGTPHTFRNSGTTPLKMLIQMSPSGFETFFASSAEEFAKATGPDMERVMAISAQHGIQFVT
jgi:mannose-6-phosphate isomerase-like protein (cupin superfamily)